MNIDPEDRRRAQEDLSKSMDNVGPFEEAVARRVATVIATAFFAFILVIMILICIALARVVF